MELAFLLRVVDAKVIWITNQHTDEKNKVTYSLVHKMLDRGIQVSQVMLFLFFFPPDSKN